jgi:hypothetical protein
MARKLPQSGLFWALLAALAATLTLGARTLPAPDGSWIGILPPGWVIAAILVAAIGVLIGGRLAADRWPALAGWPALAWSPLLLVVLGWVPLPLPEARFVWLGPLAWLAWIAVACGGIAALAPRLSCPPWLRERRRGGWVAGLAALAVCGAAWLAVRSILPGGDEPHYLIIAESLRRDGDLAIDDNHARGDYRPFFRGELAPDYLRRGTDGRIYSIHAPGLPAVVLPAYAAFGYAGVVAALLVVSAWGAMLAWRLVLDATADAGAAWFAWAAVVLAAPVLFHAFTVFPVGVAGVGALIALRTLVRVSRAADADGGAPAARRDLLAAGTALALLPWLHTRAVVIAVILGAAIAGACWWRDRSWRALATLLAVPAVSAVGWFGYFAAIYGTPNPSAPYGGYVQTAWAHVPAGLAGLLFDAQFGVLGVAPVFALAVPGLVWMLAARTAATGSRLVALVLALAFVAYVGASASYRMWWGGASAPARFAVPLLWPLALPIGIAWSRLRHVPFRVLAMAALVLTVSITATLVVVDGGRLAYGSRTTVAGWARWASPAVDLARALPGVHRSSPGAAARLGVVWLGAAAAAWVALAAIARGTGGPAGARAAGGLVIGLAATAAVAVAWQVDGHGAGPRLPGGAEQAALAAWQRQPRATLIEGGSRVRRTTPANARAHLVLPAAPVGEGRGLRLDLPALVPGRYRVRHSSPLPSALALRVGRSGLDWRRWDASSSGTLDVHVPVTVPGAAFWPLDASAAAAAPPFTRRTVSLEPIALTPSATGGADAARQVVRYGAHDVFFLDEDSYPEAPGFWVGPGRSRIVVGETAAPVSLLVRNAPIANRVELIAGPWRRAFDLAPGEELRVEVPPAGPATPIEVRASAGVRPFDGDPRNRDFRLLAVWIAIGD